MAVVLMGARIFAAPPAGDAAKGKAVFEDNCAVCHNADSDENQLLVPFELRGKQGQYGEKEKPDGKPHGIEAIKPPGVWVNNRTSG